MYGNQLIPLMHLSEFAPFEPLYTQVIQIVMVVAEQANDLFGCHIEGNHQTFNDELSRCESVV